MAATAVARLSNLRIAPRKVRLVADLIRGKKVSQARDVLRFTIKKSRDPIWKLLESAVANAENTAIEKNERIDTDELYVTRIMVNEGRTLSRFQPRARGRACKIRKRSSHVELVLSETKKQ